MSGQEVFAGGGEMGALMRATDWSKTRLGPVENWPQSLRTMLGVVLGSRFPMLLWWGPDLLHLYNDAYRPILRDKHPASLAAPAAEVWAEVWEVAGPMARGVQEGGPATWTEDLQLFIKSGDMAEETYFTFSYSPVPGDDGRVGGLLNTVQETSAKVQGERQIRMLHELAARAADAKSEDEAYRIVSDVLATNELDLPFSLLYVVSDKGHEARLAGVSGWKEYEGPGKPTELRIGEETGRDSWPVTEVIRGAREVLVDDLEARFGSLPLGRWNARPERAIALPLFPTGHSAPSALLVAGISPHRALDERYRRFFRATAAQVANVVANVRASEADRKRAEALVEIDRAKTAFFGNVSHEFRTPLTLILGPIEEAVGSADKALRGDDLEAVHRNALRLLRLVNSLLEFSRAEAGRLQMSFEPFDLAVLTAGLAGSFQSLVEEAGLELLVDCPALPEEVYVDRTHWEKIVLNLVSNAFKFTFEGRIAVVLGWCGDHVELRVRDTGTGIPASELPRVFERFHRVEGARGRSFEGTGIGLALVRELVTIHGGSVLATSVEGEGTTFVVSIPTGSGHLPPDRIVTAGDRSQVPSGTNPLVLEAAHWSSHKAKETGSAPNGAGDGDGELSLDDAISFERPTEVRNRILVVDDNSDMREYLTRLLLPHWNVETANDGEAGLASARAHPPDLVLSDMMMPVMDGATLVRALREDSRTNAIPVILLSARAGQEAVLGGLETGADDYLVKPFAARELLSRVSTHLKMARIRRSAADAARELADVRAALLNELELKHRALEDAFRDLQATQAQLIQSAKMASLGELVAGVAHEINNPLAFAASHLDTVQRVLQGIDASVGSGMSANDRERWDRARDRLREMSVGLERIRELVVRLRTFSRLDEGEQKQISVRESVESVLTMVRHRVKGRVEVLTHFGEPDLLDCYAGLFNQAIMNLVSNAIDAIHDRGVITISTGAEGSAYVIVVSDTGTGIPANIRDRVFEPFFTTKPVGQGTGLGLSITYSIVKKHGGTLELRPRSGGGTDAVIHLPSLETRVQATSGNA